MQLTWMALIWLDRALWTVARRAAVLVFTHMLAHNTREMHSSCMLPATAGCLEGAMQCGVRAERAPAQLTRCMITGLVAKDASMRGVSQHS